MAVGYYLPSSWIKVSSSVCMKSATLFYIYNGVIFICLSNSCSAGGSQEVGYKGLVRNSFRCLVPQSVEDVERFLQLVAHVQDRCHVTASVAIVRSRPHRDQVLVSEPVLESVHHELVSSCDERNVVDVVELRRDLGAEEPSSSSWGHCPGVNVFRIRPHEVAERSFVGDLHSSVDESDLVDGLDFGGEASVDAEDLSLDDGTDSEVVEHLSAVLPGVGVSILSNGLVIESVDSGDLPSFVVASEQGDVRGVLELQAEKELEGLNRVESSVHEVSHEDVASVRDFTALIEEFEEIMELTMDVSADGDWSLDWLDVALFDEDLLDLLAKDSQFSLREDSSVLNSLEPAVDVRLSAHGCLLFFIFKI